MIFCYYITKRVLKNWIAKKLDRFEYSSFLQMYSKENPWKSSVYLRLLFIPINYKNYLISMLEISFWQFFIPGAVHYVLYFSIFLVIGSILGETVSSHQQKISIGEVLAKNDLVMALGKISLLFMFQFFLIFTCYQFAKLQEFKKFQ